MQLPPNRPFRRFAVGRVTLAGLLGSLTQTLKQPWRLSCWAADGAGLSVVSEREGLTGQGRCYPMREETVTVTVTQREQQRLMVIAQVDRG